MRLMTAGVPFLRSVTVTRRLALKVLPGDAKPRVARAFMSTGSGPPAPLSLASVRRPPPSCNPASKPLAGRCNSTQVAGPGTDTRPVPRPPPSTARAPTCGRKQVKIERRRRRRPRRRIAAAARSLRRDQSPPAAVVPRPSLQTRRSAARRRRAPATGWSRFRQAREA